MASHIIEDRNELVFVLGVARQVIRREIVHRTSLGLRMVRLHHPQLPRQLILLDQWLNLWAGERQVGVHSLV